MGKVEWYAYEYLKKQSEENKWTSQTELQEVLNQKFDNKFCLRTIRKIIQRIRQCDTIQKIIITNYSKGYRLMSTDEETDYLVRRKQSILKMLKACYKDIKRYEANNQYRIFENKERDIIESLVQLKANER